MSRRGITDPLLVERLALDHDEIRTEAPGAIEAIQQGRADGIRLALITNGMAAGHRAKIDRAGLAACLDLILIEGEFGTKKPDGRVYEHVLDRLHLKAAGAVMLGDNGEWNVAGARAVGIPPVRVNRGGRPRPDGGVWPGVRTIRSLAELLPS